MLSMTKPVDYDTLRNFPRVNIDFGFVRKVYR